MRNIRSGTSTHCLNQSTYKHSKSTILKKVHGFALNVIFGTRAHRSKETFFKFLCLKLLKSIEAGLFWAPRGGPLGKTMLRILNYYIL